VFLGRMSREKNRKRDGEGPKTEKPTREGRRQGIKARARVSLMILTLSFRKEGKRNVWSETVGVTGEQRWSSFVFP